MGMDVYGNAPTNEVGEYFRRSVWGWRPLWDYCLENFEVANKVELGHSNDGDGLNRANALRLARQIRAEIENGNAEQYVNARNARLAALPRTDCEYCEGTGIRKDKVGIEFGFPERELSPEQVVFLGRDKGWCNACQGEGKNDHWDTNYLLDLDDIKEFAEFLENCGGFEIC